MTCLGLKSVYRIKFEIQVQLLTHISWSQVYLNLYVCLGWISYNSAEMYAGLFLNEDNIEVVKA